jgi:hypothetical protein
MREHGTEASRSRRRQDKRVILVLVSGARMPSTDELSQSTRALALRNTVGLR